MSTQEGLLITGIRHDILEALEDKRNAVEAAARDKSKDKSPLDQFLSEDNTDQYAGFVGVDNPAEKIACLTRHIGLFSETTPTDEVTLGSIVVIESPDGSRILAMGDDYIQLQRAGVNIISPKSPAGKALTGKREGDTVSYQAPNGTMMKHTIITIN